MGSTYVNVLAIANKEISIGDLLEELYGIEVLHGIDGWKTYCPYGGDHSDGGKSKALKVFDSNTAWCFSHGQRYTPVSLWQNYRGIPNPVTAARDLLSAKGLLQQLIDPEARWDRLDELEAQEQDRIPDTTPLKESLLMFARSLPNYEAVQYRDDVLDLMSNLYPSAKEAEKLRDMGSIENWLETSKRKLIEHWRDNEYT